MVKRMPLPTVLAASLILVAVLLPGSSLPDAPGIPGIDKLAHFVLFLGLAVAVHLDFGLEDGRGLGFAIVAALAFSALTEALQLMVDGRSAELFDMAADMAGFIVGLMSRRPLASLAARLGRLARRALGGRRGA